MLFTVARAVLLLLHKPPEGVEVNVTVDIEPLPSHTVAAPVIAVGVLLTLIGLAMAQPVGRV